MNKYIDKIGKEKLVVLIQLSLIVLFFCHGIGKEIRKIRKAIKKATKKKKKNK